MVMLVRKRKYDNWDKISLGLSSFSLVFLLLPGTQELGAVVFGLSFGYFLSGYFTKSPKSFK